MDMKEIFKKKALPLLYLLFDGYFSSAPAIPTTTHTKLALSSNPWEPLRVLISTSPSYILLLNKMPPVCPSFEGLENKKSEEKRKSPVT